MNPSTTPPSPQSSQLPHLPQISRVSASVIRILGGNPGGFTLQGTNTYLISPPDASHRLLLDTGQGSQFPIWRESVREVLDSESARLGKEVTITQCVLTHWHYDHVGGIQDLRRLCAGEDGSGRIDSRETTAIDSRNLTLYKFPLFDEPSSPTLDPSMENLSEARSDVQTRERESQLMTSANDDQDIGVLQAVANEQILEVGDQNSLDREKLKLKVVRTPGHTADHIALAIVSSPSDPEEVGCLFTGDAVLGHGTAVFEELGAYVKSLRRMKDVAEQLSIRREREESKYEEEEMQKIEEKNPRVRPKAFPGHGAVITDAIAKITEYIAHRAMREREILEVLAGSSPMTPADRIVDTSNVDEGRGGNSAATQATPEWTVPQIVRTVYKDVNVALHVAAARGVEQVLVKLGKEGRVKREQSSGEEGDATWKIVQDEAQADDSHQHTRPTTTHKAAL